MGYDDCFSKHNLTKQIVEASLSFSNVNLLFDCCDPKFTRFIYDICSTKCPLEIVNDLFSDKDTRLLGWLHFLALDTLGGRWIWSRLQSQSKPLIQSAPTLILCMMVAPLGILIGLITTIDKEKSCPFGLI